MQMKMVWLLVRLIGEMFVMDQGDRSVILQDN